MIHRKHIYRLIDRSLKTILLFVFCVFLCVKNTSTSAQTSSNHRNGTYLGGQKGWNIFKSRKKFSHIKNKKSRKKASKKNNNYRKQSSQKRKKQQKFNKKNSHFKRNGKVNLKKTKLGKKGSLYSYNKKKSKNITALYLNKVNALDSGATLNLARF